jgi:hypothetical protein
VKNVIALVNGGCVYKKLSFFSFQIYLGDGGAFEGHIFRRGPGVVLQAGLRPRKREAARLWILRIFGHASGNDRGSML